MIKTYRGWHDMKIGIFACSERGEAVTPADWNRLDVPVPTIRVAVPEIYAAAERLLNLAA